MKNPSFKTTSLSIMVLIIFGCASTSNVVADHDPEADFSIYKTFTICEEDMLVQNLNYPKYDNDENRNKIKEAVTEHMKQKGFTLEEENPQLQAGFELMILDKEMMVTNCMNERESVYWPECKLETYNYTEQTLVIYVIDLEKNQIIWQGSVAGGLSGSAKKMARSIDETVAEIFTTYPM